MASDAPEGPAREGFRWPAEWQPHRATWLAWPHNPDTWPGRLAAVEDAFVEMVRALAGRERVRISAGDAPGVERVGSLLQRRLGPLAGAVDLFPFPTDDAWVRDHGPVFLVHPGRGELAAADFPFDAWGGKYPPWDRDAAIPAQVAKALGIRRFEAGFVLEGGSVEGDGAGTLLTTEACLLHANREPGRPRTREGMEARLSAWLGAERVVWLGDGIEGDDTDGHVDDLARFVAPGLVVAAAAPDPADPNHAALAANLARLRAARDAHGRALEVVELPMPPPVMADGAPCPASYANFYLANGCALLPAFDAASDDRARRVLAELLPGREIVPIPARDLVRGLGAVHCLTQQEPEPEPEPEPAG